jgi:hypothetical protein
MFRVGFTSIGKQALEIVPCHDFGKKPFWLRVV